MNTDYANFLNMIAKVNQSHFLRDDMISNTKQVGLHHRGKELFTVFFFDRDEKFLGTSLEEQK